MYSTVQYTEYSTCTVLFIRNPVLASDSQCWWNGEKCCTVVQSFWLHQDFHDLYCVLYCVLRRVRTQARNSTAVLKILKSTIIINSANIQKQPVHNMILMYLIFSPGSMLYDCFGTIESASIWGSGLWGIALSILTGHVATKLRYLSGWVFQIRLSSQVICGILQFSIRMIRIQRATLCLFRRAATQVRGAVTIPKGMEQGLLDDAGIYILSYFFSFITLSYTY